MSSSLALRFIPTLVNKIHMNDQNRVRMPNEAEHMATPIITVR
jgi:hypothetical protein